MPADNPIRDIWARIRSLGRRLRVILSADHILRQHNVPTRRNLGAGRGVNSLRAQKSQSHAIR